MYFIVQHRDIKDWDSFSTKSGEVTKAPGSLESLQYLPLADHSAAFCVWYADSEATLKQYLDGFCAGLSTNTYFRIDERIATNLPKVPAAV